MIEEDKSRSTTTTIDEDDNGEILNESSGSTGTQEDQQVPKSDQSLDPPL